MVRMYSIDDDSERYIPIRLDELVPGTKIPFEIFTHDGSIIKSLLDKGSTYSYFARKMVENQGLSNFYIRQGNSLTFDEYMHNAAKLKKMILDPHFFESGYREFRKKWFIIDKHALNSGIPFTLPLGGMRFPLFGEIPFSVDTNSAYAHLLNLDSDIAVRKRDVNAYYGYLDNVLDAEWIEDPLVKCRARREKLKVWCYRVLEEAGDNAISEDALRGLFKHISIVMTLMANDFKHAGHFLFLDVSDMFPYNHSTNVCLLSMMIGRLMNMEEAAVLNLGICAMLHDVGCATIDDDVSELSPTEAEREMFKSHVLKGKELLEPCKDVPKLAKIVALTHHEAVDGSGYVYGMTADKIHLFSKITAVADTFERLAVAGYRHTSMRPGKAIEEMATHDKKFDHDVLKIFIRLVAGLTL